MKHCRFAVYIYFLAMFSVGCSVSAENSTGLLDLASRFPSLEQKTSYRYETSLLRKSLENILQKAEDPAYLYRSIEAIKKEAEQLGFQTQFIGGNLAITTKSYSTKKNRIFFFNLTLSENIPKKDMGSRDSIVSASIVEGYQSLYPKGVLISLLYAWKKLEESHKTTADKIEILISRNSSNSSAVSSGLTQNWDDNAVVIMPVPERYSFAQKEGGLNFQVQIPLDRSHPIRDIMTRGGEVIVTYRPSVDATQSQTKTFSLSSRTVSEKRIVQDLTGLARFLRKYESGNGILSKEQERVFVSAIGILPTGKNSRPIEPFSSIELLLLSSFDSKLNFYFHAPLRSDFSLPQGSDTRNFFRDLLQKNFFFSLERPREGYQIIFSNYSAPYNAMSNVKIRGFYENAMKAFQATYHTTKTFSEGKNNVSIWAGTESFPTFFMGFFPGSPSFYSHVGYVPEMKLYLDQEYFYRLLSQYL